ncbi:MAG TPA: M1 family aminopeptidase [Polyangiaceae bacterium]|nr:M1 family aminopeptidase [Polyangiaceae bacterium]
MGRAAFGGALLLALSQGAACGGKSAVVHDDEPAGGTGHAPAEGGSSGGSRVGGSTSGGGGGGGGNHSGSGSGSGGAPARGGASGTTQGGTSSGVAGSAGSTDGNAGAAGAVPEAGAGGADDSGPASNPGRDIEHTSLNVNLDTSIAIAAIAVGPSERAGASFEVGDLTIDSVTIQDAPVAFRVQGQTLDVDVPPAKGSTPLRVVYHFSEDTRRGWSGTGYTLTWPYFCGYLFPCHSAPSDGSTFELRVTSSGNSIVYAPKIPTEVPSYVMAWAQGNYREKVLGTTSAGTNLSVFYLATVAGAEDDADTGTTRLRDGFEWYEEHLGAYRFGTKVGSVAVEWPSGSYGGMEHHPLWHIATVSMAEPLTHLHEAAHGWFGDGVRIRCWEDLVLSEGTASYLSVHVLEALGETEAANAAWTKYEDESSVQTTGPVWLTSCGEIDVLDSSVYSEQTYARGALFYRALEERVGTTVLEDALRQFYAAFQGEAARFEDLLGVVHETTGYDAQKCAASWLTGTTAPPFAACP